MAKEIICVYQDCPMCGDRGKRLKKFIAKKGLNVRKVSFASPEGRELCAKAITEYKIGTMPFFTDGKKFSATLKGLLERKTTKKAVKKATKKAEIAEEGGENGTDS